MFCEVCVCASCEVCMCCGVCVCLHRLFCLCGGSYKASEGKQSCVWWRDKRQRGSLLIILTASGWGTARWGAITNTLNIIIIVIKFNSFKNHRVLPKCCTVRRPDNHLFEQLNFKHNTSMRTIQNQQIHSKCFLGNQTKLKQVTVCHIVLKDKEWKCI